MHKTSSAFEKASLCVRLPYISDNFSFIITITLSQSSFKNLIPSLATSIFSFPSKRKGIVTIPIVSISNSLANFAIIGAAPVPVPPPIPAVINNIFVSFFKISLIS